MVACYNELPATLPPDEVRYPVVRRWQNLSGGEAAVLRFLYVEHTAELWIQVGSNYTDEYNVHELVTEAKAANAEFQAQ